VLEVTDNGPGIPATDHARVFERFVRGTDTGDGCGLGLAIVREIVERSAGQVELQPALPQGLCVRIELPMAAP
jgi:two-component system sensor histidine kinase TctE